MEGGDALYFWNHLCQNNNLFAEKYQFKNRTQLLHLWKLFCCCCRDGQNLISSAHNPLCKILHSARSWCAQRICSADRLNEQMRSCMEGQRWPYFTEIEPCPKLLTRSGILFTLYMPMPHWRAKFTTPPLISLIRMAQVKVFLGYRDQSHLILGTKWSNFLNKMLTLIPGISNLCHCSRITHELRPYCQSQPYNFISDYFIYHK